MKQYICTRIWARHTPGDIIAWDEYKRIPKEVQDRCFKEYRESAPITRSKGKLNPNPMVEAKPAGYTPKTGPTSKETPTDESK